MNFSKNYAYKAKPLWRSVVKLNIMFCVNRALGKHIRCLNPIKGLILLSGAKKIDIQINYYVYRDTLNSCSILLKT